MMTPLTCFTDVISVNKKHKGLIRMAVAYNLCTVGEVLSLGSVL